MEKAEFSDAELSHMLAKAFKLGWDAAMGDMESNIKHLLRQAKNGGLKSHEVDKLSASILKDLRGDL